MPAIILLPKYNPLYEAAVLADTPVAYWRLDESAGPTIVDQMAAYPGTVVGTPTFSLAGLTSGAGSSARVNGASDRFEITGTPLGSGNSTQFTIEAWINLPSTSSGHWIYGQRNGGGESNGLLTITAAGKLSFDKQPPSGNPGVGSLTLTPGQTYHVVYTESSSTRTFYVNGSVDITDALAETYSGSAITFGLLGNDSLAALSDPIVLDEVALYDYALGPDRVLAHYNAGV